MPLIETSAYGGTVYVPAAKAAHTTATESSGASVGPLATGHRPLLGATKLGLRRKVLRGPIGEPARHAFEGAVERGVRGVGSCSGGRRPAPDESALAPHRVRTEASAATAHVRCCCGRRPVFEG